MGCNSSTVGTESEKTKRSTQNDKQNSNHDGSQEDNSYMDSQIKPIGSEALFMVP
ncbi:unnamed protein product, partial [Rotaria magnacalcarata]